MAGRRGGWRCGGRRRLRAPDGSPARPQPPWCVHAAVAPSRPGASAASASESSCSTLTTVWPSATSARTVRIQSAWCGGSRLAERLVHQQQLGLDRQRARQQHALALAAGELAQRPLAPVPGLRRCAVRCSTAARSAALGARQPALVRQAAEHGDVVDRQVVGAALAGPALAQPGQPLRPLAARPVAPAVRRADGPRPRRARQAGQHLEQGRLARAVGADDAGPAPRTPADRCRAAPRQAQPCSSRRSLEARPLVLTGHLARCAGASATADSCRRARRSARPPAAPAARSASAPAGRPPSAAARPSRRWTARSAPCVVLTAERTRCGAARPTNAISPVCATAAPVASASTATSAARSVRQRQPQAGRVASPSAAVEHRRQRPAQQQAAATPPISHGAGAPADKPGAAEHEACMACRMSARRWSPDPRRAPSTTPTITPASSRRSVCCTPRASSSVSSSRAQRAHEGRAGQARGARTTAALANPRDAAQRAQRQHEDHREAPEALPSR